MLKNQQRCSIKLSLYYVATAMKRPIRTDLETIAAVRPIHRFRNSNIPFRAYASLSPDLLFVQSRLEPSRSAFYHRGGCGTDFLALLPRRFIFTGRNTRNCITLIRKQFCNNQKQLCHPLYQLQHRTHQRAFVSSFKTRRARRRKHERLRALMKPEDSPSLLLDENIVYMTTEEQINQWVSDTVLKDEKIAKLLSTPTKSIYAGVHAVWLDSENNNTSMDGHDSNIIGNLRNNSQQKLRQRRIVLLQISLPQLPVAVVHFTEIYKDSTSTSTTGGSHAFPNKLKELLEVPNLVVCSINVNELCTTLYCNYHVSCLIRVELMDLAKKAISYQQSADDGNDVNERNFLTRLRRYGSSLLSLPKSKYTTMNRLLQSSDVKKDHNMDSIDSRISKMMDQLCYYFLAVANRPKKLDFERPTSLTISSMASEPLTNQRHIRYYASHVYHARLLALALLDLVDDGEENLFHDDCETVVYFNDPNIPFHPTIDQLPQPLSLNRKVAILMTDDEYHDALTERDDNQLNTSLIKSDFARHPFSTRHSRKSMLFVKDATDEFKMMKPYSRKILAIGLIEFLGDPHGIMKRFDTTSYLVGRCNDPTIPLCTNYEDEAIVRLQKVKHPNYPITSLNCNDEKYWIDYPLHYCYNDENDNNNIEADPQYRWPTIPTLGWVLKNALRPLVIVDQSRLVLFNKDEVIDPNDKPWLPKKREDTLPLIPPDISKYL